ncbi:hypothetical protein KY328_04635 [Candidatus Woesearchaeota archaeon]|nr:hypothetical protein [Candidatus Woesearchaeota archaeon]MBW3022184.1 hypothetical protein [Candidatus Woesearchaeota archaeon]
MVDLSHKTIEDLFFKQIKDLTQRTYGAKNAFIPRFSATDMINSFDIQFSDQWI